MIASTSLTKCFLDKAGYRYCAANPCFLDTPRYCAAKARGPRLSRAIARSIERAATATAHCTLIRVLVCRGARTPYSAVPAMRVEMSATSDATSAVPVEGRDVHLLSARFSTFLLGDIFFCHVHGIFIHTHDFYMQLQHRTHRTTNNIMLTRRMKTGQVCPLFPSPAAEILLNKGGTSKGTTRGNGTCLYNTITFLFKHSQQHSRPNRPLVSVEGGFNSPAVPPQQSRLPGLRPHKVSYPDSPIPPHIGRGFFLPGFSNSASSTHRKVFFCLTCHPSGPPSCWSFDAPLHRSEPPVQQLGGAESAPPSCWAGGSGPAAWRSGSKPDSVNSSSSSSKENSPPPCHQLRK